MAKQAQELMFSRQTKKLLQPYISFDKISLKNSMCQKYLGLILDTNLNFFEHVKNITRETGNELIASISTNHTKISLLTVYKTFIRSQLDYSDVIYFQSYDSTFHKKLVSHQYNACLATTESMRGTSSGKLYQELRWISIRQIWVAQKTHFGCECFFNLHLKIIKFRLTVINPLIFCLLKGALMQIWKSPYMFVFIKGQYPENFAF